MTDNWRGLVLRSGNIHLYSKVGLYAGCPSRVGLYQGCIKPRRGVGGHATFCSAHIDSIVLNVAKNKDSD